VYTVISTGSDVVDEVRTLPRTVLSSQQQSVPSSRTLHAPPVSARITTTVSMTEATCPTLVISMSSGILTMDGAWTSGGRTSFSVLGPADEALMSLSDMSESTES
jgi:hypothetical protein